jgi:succinate-acetate transporter protein
VVHSEISPLPAKVGSATIMLDLSDLSAKPVSGAGIVLEAVMTHAGMASVFGGSTEVAPGRYSGNLAFSMPGDWVVLLHMKLADGTKVERQIEVKGVRAN